MPGQMKAVDIVIGSAELIAEHPELFHYTRRPAFEAILGSNTLWATHFRDLDDKNEIATLKPLLLRSLADIFDAEVKTRSRAIRNKYRHRGGSIPHAERFIASLYAATFDKNKPRFAVDAFTTSFTTHVADSAFERSNGLPSQWTRYAPDGFCIVLDTAAMCDLLGSEFDTRDYTHLNLERVRYAFEAGQASAGPKMSVDSASKRYRFSHTSTALSIPHGNLPTLAYRVETQEVTVVYSSDQTGTNPRFFREGRGHPRHASGDRTGLNQSHPGSPRRGRKGGAERESEAARIESHREFRSRCGGGGGDEELLGSADYSCRPSVHAGEIVGSMRLAGNVLALI
jgi:hypothetical protein